MSSLRPAPAALSESALVALVRFVAAAAAPADAAAAVVRTDRAACAAVAVLASMPYFASSLAAVAVAVAVDVAATALLAVAAVPARKGGVVFPGGDVNVEIVAQHCMLAVGRHKMVWPAVAEVGYSLGSSSGC